MRFTIETSDAVDLEAVKAFADAQKSGQELGFNLETIATVVNAGLNYLKSKDSAGVLSKIFQSYDSEKHAETQPDGNAGEGNSAPVPRE